MWAVVEDVKQSWVWFGRDWARECGHSLKLSHEVGCGLEVSGHENVGFSGTCPMKLGVVRKKMGPRVWALVEIVTIKLGVIWKWV